MTTEVSTHYRPLTRDEAVQVARETADAWKDASIPMRQYELAVMPELAKWSRGELVMPFVALTKCLRCIPYDETKPGNLLDIGASSGFYRAVLMRDNYAFTYTALDFSPAFKALAEKLYPGIDFRLGDARSLPFEDESFSIVLSGCCILHIPEYETAIREAARVAKKHVIFSKTPVHSGETEFFEKQAYGIRCLEIRFNETELLNLFERYGLRLEWTEPAGAGHKTYLLRKLSLSEREWERA